ncbi:MAG TPA: radical SAM family heme chaperone HemW [Desulfurivibrionaceae bacterium]|nr:radical SAM family heme chaperone HemW [Desulfurivibrionaceae bacterium]
MAAPTAGPEPAGIYVHIPFCRSKCGYCAFASYPLAGHDPEAYLAALSREIAYYREQAWCRGRVFDSLFLGGGTPTILGAAQLTGLLDNLRESFTVSPDAEISVESNPNTVDAKKLAALATAGVNRLSLGIQTFDDQTLRRIDRSHTAAEGERAVNLARQAGFTNLSLDLIYGLPGQSPAAWRETLARGVALAPQHLSVYQLSIEPGSRFAELAAAGKLTLPDEASETEMAEETVTFLTRAGFERYEISNYARTGFRCRHNLNYWRNRSWLGLGAGAVGALSGLRLRNSADPQLYQKYWGRGQPAWLEAEGLDRERSFRETVIMGLRLLEGLDLSELRERFGIELQRYYGATLEQLVAKGLLQLTDHRLRLTDRALPVANQVLAELV